MRWIGTSEQKLPQRPLSKTAAALKTQYLTFGSMQHSEISHEVVKLPCQIIKLRTIEAIFES